MKGTLTAVGQGAKEVAITADRNKKQVIFTIHDPFANYIGEVNNAQVDYAKDLDAVMPMYI